MAKVFITGVSGFAGSHLAEYLAENSPHTIYGTYLDESSLKNISSIKEKINTVRVDLTNQEKVEEIINDLKPDFVYHLAALSAPSKSFSNPTGTIMNNVSIQLNILEAIRKINIQPKIIVVSSADIYGVVKPGDLTIDEQTPVSPTNPYSLSKLVQDFLGLQYFSNYKMDIVRVRPFNHIGPRQAPFFVVPAFAKKIAEIEKNVTPPILKVGSLDTKRDFTDVRDMVRAYVLLMEKGVGGDVYNIGSGKSYVIKDILDQLLSLSKVNITIEQDPELLRPTDNPELLANVNKMQELTGWKPEIILEQTLKDTLDYYRNIV